MNAIKSVQIFLVIILLGCASCAHPRISPQTTQEPEAIRPTSTSNPLDGAGVRPCDYIPGKSVPTQIPAGDLANQGTNDLPKAISISNSSVDAPTTSKQLEIYQQIWDLVNNHYANRDFNGKDWEAIGQQYQSLIKKGLKQDGFTQAMKEMLFNLDGGLSTILTSEEWAKAGNSEFVGIGALYTTVQINGQSTAVMMDSYPGSPVEKAGLKKHDILLKVDGGPFLDISGQSRALGMEGTTVTVTVQTPGQPPRDLSMVRQKISGSIPIDICLVSGTHIGYIHWLNNLDSQQIDQIISEIKKLSQSGPLYGLVIDTRGFAGGDKASIKTLLSLFTEGELGNYASAGSTEPLVIDKPMNIAGSQNVPLILLQDESSASIGLLINGILQMNGRAQIVGSPNPNPFYFSENYPLPDGSQLAIPTGGFQPKGKSFGYFNTEGVRPDFPVLSRWDLFTEGTDPLLAKAVEEITKEYLIR